MAQFVLTAQLQLQAPNNVAKVVNQIQNQLRGVSVNVQAQGTAQANRQVQQLSKSLNTADNAASNLGRTFALSFKRFAAFSVATRAVSLFTNTLSKAVEEAIDFERQLVKISQVTGTSLTGLRDLTNAITNLSTGLGVSSKDLLNVSQILAQAGLSAQDTKTALDALAKTALSPTFDDISETAEGAIAILAQFKLGVGALEAQLGSINAVAGKFAVESSDLIEVIRRTGGVFKASGGSLNELIALFTSVRATTRESAESIATGLRTIFTRIQRPKTIEFLKQFGVELVDLEGKFVGPYEAIRRLSDSLTGLGERDITFIQIAEELGGFRQIGKVLPLLQQFAISQEALNVAQEGSSGLAKDAATAQQALAIRITKVKEEFLALVRSISESSSFQLFANTALNLASAFIKLADTLKPLIPLLVSLAAIRLARGFGDFASGFMGGIGSKRQFNQGGKVLGFARGGMVPGSGNRDTIPAMLQPGEFVIRKSSVNKLGAGNLTAMNENRYATGGIIALNPYDKGTPDTSIRKNGFITVADVAERAGIPTNKGYRERFMQAAGVSGNPELALLAKTGKLNINAIGLSVGDENVASETETQIKDSFANLINTSSGALAAKFQTTQSKQITAKDLELFGINGVIGNAFEAMLTSLGAPFDSPPQDEMQKAVSKANNNSAFDYPNGIGILGKGNLAALASIPTDAKRTVTGKEVNEIISKKYPNLLADAAKQSLIGIKGQELSSLKPKEGGYLKGELEKYGIRNIAELKAQGWTSPSRGRWNPPTTRHYGGLISKFASGGGVGTDTVPALLTPGEFVINKKASQNIGYGNLNRMNKVGKYANGGIVQRFAEGGAVAATADNTNKATGKTANSINNLGNSANKTAANLNKSSQTLNVALFAVTGALNAFMPTIDENSTTVDYFKRNLIETANQLVALATILQSFGGIEGVTKIAKDSFNSLKNKISQFKDNIGLLGKKTAIASASVNTLGSSARAGAIANQLSTASESAEAAANNAAVVSETAELTANKASTVAESAETVADTAEAVASSAAAGPLLALVAVVAIIIGVIYSLNKAFADAAEAAKKRAIERGDVQTAGQKAVEEAQFNANNDYILAIFGPLGIAAAGIARSLRSSDEYFRTYAEAQAQAVKTQNALNKASEDMTKTMEEYEKGTISANEAVRSLSIASAEVIAQIESNRRANAAASAERSTGLGATFRDIVTLGGVLGEASATRNARLDKEIADREEESKKSRKELVKIAQPALRAQMTETAMGGGSFESFLEILKKENEALYDIIVTDEEAMENQRKSYDNLTKEIERNKKAAEAMNLYLRGPTAAAGAMSAEMQRFAEQISGQSLPALSALDLLAASATEAGAAMSQVAISSAIGDVSSLLSNLGGSADSIAKFENTAQAFATAQKEFDNVAKDIKGLGKGLSVKQIQEEFATRLGNKLPEELRKQFVDIIGGVQLSPEQTARAQAGDLSVFAEIIGEKGKEFLEPLIKIAQEYADAQKVLIDLAKKQIDAQRNYVEAIQQAQDLIMEGREVQAKYGGRAVSVEERRASILTKANARNQLTGLGQLRTGNAAELAARNAEIRARFNVNQAALARGQGAGTEQGERLRAQQEDLKSAQKEQIQTIRDLIKLEEENLKLIGEKNKLEKDSINALISGDIDKFFEGLEAQGAKAAIATGNVSLQQAFGAKALGAAAADIQRMQEAGVQTLYGQQLGGAGGLTERGFGAALGARGIQDARLAAIAAGTTTAEEAAKSRLRDLGGALGAAGQLGADIAAMEVDQATINVQNAEIKMQEIAERAAELANRQQAVGMSRGGTVYANNGIFVPRGTDTVPAMLTPGEFVVRREAVQRGNNLQMLKAMNNGSISSGSVGMAKGGSVGQAQYLAFGGFAQAVNNLTGGDFLKKLTDTFNSFVSDMNSAIGNLSNTNIKHKIDTTSVNHNFNGLANLREDIKKEILTEVGQKLSNMSVGEGGRLKENKGVV